MVNGIFKNMGRHRPYSVEAFGGPETFTKPFVLGQWGHGDSFISGHVSMAYLFLALAFLVRGPWRKPAFAVAVLFGLAMGVARVVQGDHFTSDVLLCGVILYLLCAALLPVLNGTRWEQR
jgi:lipid A 4'-phosphatase